MKLTAKQQKFCEEYLIDLNATQAAIRAGYSQKTANEQASRMLAKVNIQERIAEKQSEASDRTSITVDFVLNGIKDIAVEGEQENNRLKAFDMLSKHLGIYEKDNKLELGGMLKTENKWTIEFVEAEDVKE